MRSNEWSPHGHHGKDQATQNSSSGYPSQSSVQLAKPSALKLAIKPLCMGEGNAQSVVYL